MASSSKRLTRFQVKEAVAKSFRTFVYPDKDRVEVCPKFRVDWNKHSERHPYAWLVHPSGNNCLMEFHISERDFYMTSGRMASILYGFKEAIEVIVDYQFTNEDIVFKMRGINEKEVIDLSSDDELGNDVSVDDTYTLFEFGNDRVFGWEMMVSEAYVSVKKQQVLHLPPRMGLSVLRNKESIVLRTRHNLDGTTCTIKTYIRKKNSEKKERFLTEGWYEFKKANRLRKGDKLQFQLSDPPNVIVVDIIRKSRRSMN